MNIVYTAEALATGEGRNGHARTSDGRSISASPFPRKWVAAAKAPTEQLFAAGYAACFHSALQMVARAEKANVADSAVGARVGIGPNGAGGFGLAVTLEVSLPHLPHDQPSS